MSRQSPAAINLSSCEVTRSRQPILRRGGFITSNQGFDTAGLLGGQWDFSLVGSTQWNDSLTVCCLAIILRIVPSGDNTAGTGDWNKLNYVCIRRRGCMCTRRFPRDRYNGTD